MPNTSRDHSKGGKMIEITVKTLDSKNHSFSVPDDFTVKQFKEKIAESISISAESQRLIYCGRVLQDEKTLREYDVNGKVIHLVQRPPPVSNGSGPDRGPSNTRSTTGSNARRTPLRLFGPAGNAGNAMYLGAMAFPAEIMDASGMSMQQPRQCLSQSRLNVVRNMLRRASVILNRLENPPQTSADTSPDNGNASPERSTEEEVSAGTPDIEIVSSSSVEIAASVEITPTSFIIDNSQDLGGPSVEVQIDPAAEQNNQTPERESQSTTEQQPEQNGSEETGDGARTPSRYPRTAALADLLDQAAEVNTRVQPFMAQYQQLMRDDPTFSDQAAVATNQQLFTSVSEIMHNLAHAYHALSDIMCDFSQPPPRFLRCRPVLIHHSAVVQTGIPIQVATNLAASTGQQPNASNANARSRGNARGTGTSTTTGPAPAAAATDESSTQAPQAQPTCTNEESSPAQSSVPAPTPTTVSQAPTTDQTPAAGQAAPTAAGQNPTTGQTPLRTSRLGGYRLYESPFANVTNGSSSGRTPQMRQVSGPEFEIFVDVTPGSITIDSLETTVLPNVPINTTEANSWQNPPDFVQNLVSALAGQFMGATLQQYRFPDQQSTGTSTQQTTTATTAAAAASSTQQSASGQTPSAAAAQNSQARGNTATHPTTATQTRSTARPHVHLSPSIHGLRTNSFDPFLPCNSHHIRSGRSRQRPNQTNASNGAAATAETPRTTPTSGSNSISISVRADPVINVDQEAQRAAGNQTRSQSIFPADLQFLLSAFRGANSVMNRAPNPSTLSELLENVPGYTYTPGESIFTDIFMILAQSLTFVDLVEMRMGTSDGLLRARPQLQELITQRLLNNRPLTISAITQIVDRINSELQPHFSIFEYTRWREDIDLAASINLYNHSMLPSILNTIMEEDQTTFQATLISKCIQYTRQLCTLLQYCCVDGVSGLEAIVQAFVNQTTTDLPRILQDWTMSQSIINFHTFLGTLNVPVEDIKRYLVYHTGNNPATSPQPAATPPAIPPAAEPMDVQEVEETHSEPIPSLIREPSVADVPPTQHINEAIGWQSALPSEWVPIITRDSQRQRRQNSQGPFSDAYLSGMPSKRRKLITSAKPQGNLSQVITESMTTALSAAGMSSGPEVDVVAQRAGQDCSLRTAYREQVRATLQHNLNSHPDYLPEKYPNTTKYFKKK